MLLRARIGLTLSAAFSFSAVLLMGAAQADVRLASVFSDHMVLQRGMELPVWGDADPGEPIRATVAEQEQATTADSEGRWRVKLGPLPEGEPLTLRVDGTSSQAKVEDVLVGEVWICSGQSNMDWDLGRTWASGIETAKANHPAIRLLSIKTPAAQAPQDRCGATWQVCSPKSAGKFSAVGYYFGLELHQRLGVPIGLIDNAWGGSACEAWMPSEELRDNPMLEAIHERWEKRVANYNQDAARAKYEKALANWQAKRAATEGNPQARAKLPRQPRWDNPLMGNQRPGNLYYGRLSPVLGLGIRGAIWYQGESNAGRAYQYRDLFPRMIRTWRRDWGQGDYPFYWVQLADFQPEVEQPGSSVWAELREAQTMTLDREPKTGQAVIIDLGEGKDIHPRRKREVGQRLARHALAKDYGVKIAHESPRYESMTVEGGKVVVKLKHCETGLKTLDKREVLGFALAGEDRDWHAATAKIVGRDSIEVTSQAVQAPVAVRYAWAQNPVCNLYSKADLPVTPFRSDTWPGVTADAK